MKLRPASVFDIRLTSARLHIFLFGSARDVAMVDFSIASIIANNWISIAVGIAIIDGASTGEVA